MSGQRVDYDRIGKRYDEEAVRNRAPDPKLVEFCEQRGSGDGSGLALLDVACGTGIQLVANLARFPKLAQTGIDLHARMLDTARQKSSAIRWTLGDAAALPFQDAEFDFVSAQYCFHHFQDKPAVLGQVARVLAPGGRFAMLNMAPWKMLDWDVYRYFPQAFTRDEQDFWPEAQIQRELEKLGLVDLKVEEHRFEQRLDLRERLAFFEQRYSPSQLVALPDAAFEAGLKRMRAEIETAGAAPLPCVSAGCLVTITATQGSLEA